MISGSSVRYESSVVGVRKVVIRSPREECGRKGSLFDIRNKFIAQGRKNIFKRLGKELLFIAWDVFNPRLPAPSIWPGSTAWIPALMISDT